MKLGLRIFLSYFLVFGIGFYFLISWVLGDLRLRYLEGVEETLADQANILACVVGQQMEENRFNPEKLRQVFDKAHNRVLSIRIYKLFKTDVDTQIYITDLSGKIIFDSENFDNQGADYSKWRDVWLTLRGKYGARSSRKNEKDPSSSVLYVAAPIYINGKTAGVLTVAKPTRAINHFMIPAKNTVKQVGALAAISVFLASILTAFWLTRPIKRLTKYAKDVRDGSKRASLPKLDKSEIGEMGMAFEEMRETLEGKKYVEQYVQTFTHEIKSPLSAIRGAAELLEEESMPQEHRSRFLSNIRHETMRIQNIVDRMLRLSSLENRKTLQRIEQVFLNPVISSILQGMSPVIEKKTIIIIKNIDENHYVMGDSFLLEQALLNLIQNALEFSPAQTRVVITTRLKETCLEFTVEDKGPGIPDYAKEKIYNKFFSLQRPDTGKKSTGLGLNFVKQVAELHQGSIKLDNRPEGGVKAVMSILKRL